MSSPIINPYTGAPMGGAQKGPGGFNLSQADLMKVLTSQRVRIDMLNQQCMQLGLYVEFILEHLLAITDSEGEPLLTINVADFQSFAERRFAEIQEEVAQQQAAVETSAADALLNSIPDLNTGVELNE